MVDYSIQTCQHINSSLSVDFDFIAKTKYLQDKPYTSNGGCVIIPWHGGVI